MGLVEEIYSRISPSDDILEIEGESEIQKFYSNKCIFLTGSTGFMGKILTEKLLRSCPDLKKIYLLIRQKKGVSVTEKSKRYFEHIVSEIKSNFKKFRTFKVKPIDSLVCI